VQISLVWNARDEDSVQDDKLRKMAEVTELISFFCTCGFHVNHVVLSSSPDGVHFHAHDCRCYGGGVTRRLSLLFYTPFGPTFRPLDPM
jgi:hypothetical protein